MKGIFLLTQKSWQVLSCSAELMEGDDAILVSSVPASGISDELEII